MPCVDPEDDDMTEALICMRRRRIGVAGMQQGTSSQVLNAPVTRAVLPASEIDIVLEHRRARLRADKQRQPVSDQLDFGKWAAQIVEVLQLMRFGN